MAETEKRWFCHDCRTEWAYVYQVFDPTTRTFVPWDERTCQACASSNIEHVSFQPLMSGLDLQTTWADFESAPAPVVEDDYAGQLSALLGVPV